MLPARAQLPEIGPHEATPNRRNNIIRIRSKNLENQRSQRSISNESQGINLPRKQSQQPRAQQIDQSTAALIRKHIITINANDLPMRKVNLVGKNTTKQLTSSQDYQTLQDSQIDDQRRLVPIRSTQLSSRDHSVELGKMPGTKKKLAKLNNIYNTSLRTKNGNKYFRHQGS